MAGKIKGALLIVLFMSFAQSAWGAGGGMFHQAMSMECTYPGQTFGYWNDGVIQTGTIEIPGDHEPVKIQINSIDRIRGTAKYKSVWDEYEIAVLHVLTNLTFLDVNPIQGIRVITIYPHFCPDKKAYCSVISEHVGPAGRVAPAQMFGFCEVK